MGWPTEMWKKNTRHMSPVILAGVVFIGAAYLTALDAEWESLSKNPHPTWYESRRPYIRPVIIALSTFGALINRAVAERRKRLETEHLGKTEEDFLRENIAKGQTK